MSKKILLIHPQVEKIENFTPHLGFALLASKLKEAGHKVLVIDYAIGENYPSAGKILKQFKPDVVGISLYTAAFKVADRIIEIVKKYNKKMPILVGGPHATLYFQDLKKDKRIDYIFRGEAENYLVDIVEKAYSRKTPLVINCPPHDLSDYPLPDFTSFYQYEEIVTYPLQTSRGCPYNCSFCSVRLISSKQWRPRKPEECIEEIKKVKKILPNLKLVRIIDDNPGVSRTRLKSFLRLFTKSKFNLDLEITNLRADHFDKEIIKLMKKAGVSQIVLGVEHGHPEVFAKIDKGETLDDIRKAARLIKEAGIFLRCCFIVGLPYDTFEKFKSSIRFAKEIKADFFHWNAFTPHKGIRARKWLEKHGRVYNEIGHVSLQGTTDFFVAEPIVETPEFSREDQRKAYALAILETNNYIFRIRSIPKLLEVAIKYDLYFPVAKSLLTQPLVWLKHLIRLARCGLLVQNIENF